jgi:hypothetical protein
MSDGVVIELDSGTLDFYHVCLDVSVNAGASKVGSRNYQASSCSCSCSCSCSTYLLTLTLTIPVPVPVLFLVFPLFHPTFLFENQNNRNFDRWDLAVPSEDFDEFLTPLGLSPLTNKDLDEIKVGKQERKMYCFKVEEPKAKQTYFLVSRQDKWEKEDGSLYGSESAAWWTFAALYTVLAFLSLVIVFLTYLGYPLHFYFVGMFLFLVGKSTSVPSSSSCFSSSSSSTLHSSFSFRSSLPFLSFLHSYLLISSPSFHSYVYY